MSFLGAAATVFFNYLAAILRAIGDSRTPLVFLVASCALNIVLVLAAVPGLHLGVGGAALATVLSQGVAAALCRAHIARRVPALHVHAGDWRAARADLGRHLRLGLPMGFQASIIAIGILAVQVRLNELGPDAVAAYTSATRVDNVTMALLGSLGLAASMFAAQNLGARRPDRIRTGIRQALIMTMAGSAVVGAVMAVAGPDLVRLFVGPGEAQVVDLAAYFLRLNGSLYVVLGALFVLRGALQGLGHTAVPTITGALELCCRVAAAVVLGAQWGFHGLVWGNPLAWLAAIAVLVPAYARAHRALADDAGEPEATGAGDAAAETLPDVVATAPVGGSVPTPDSAGA